MCVRSLLLVCLLAVAAQARAQVLDPPSLRCVSVNVAGDVLLTWVPPPDPTSIFQAYEIYHSSSVGGPYNLLTSIPVYGQTTHFHAGANAQLGPQFYYMVTLSTSPPPNASVPGPVLASLFLTVNQSTPLGSAVVDWTALSSPLPPTTDPDANIVMEYPLGTWATVAQVADPITFHEEEIAVCDDSLTFRVTMVDAVGCVSTSNLAGGSFQDVTPPSIPVLTNVTVDPLTNQTLVAWSPSPQADTDGYIIVYVDPPNNIIIDTIFGQNNTQYTWTGSDADGGPESYTVAAFDTCFTGVPPSPNTSATLPPHTTIHVTTAYDKCGGNITVSWTPYQGWPVQAYEVYVEPLGGATFLLGTFPGNATSALHPDVEPFLVYCYRVKALEAGGNRISWSNRRCRNADYPPVPAWNYLRTVTVVSEDHIQVLDSVDATAEVRTYRLERSANGQPWQQVASVPGGAANVIVFNDLDVETGERSYQYRMLVDDSCGNEVLHSNLGNSILLRAEAGLDGINRLSWNGYNGWAGFVSGFEVYRSIADGPFALVGTNAPMEWTFDDNVIDLYTTNGRFCYRVVATEAGNPSGIDAVSESNEVCAIQPEQVWFPNAFIAGGYNDSFKPVIAYVDVRNYELTIFNRWGQAFWTTTDPQQAWDGHYNGQPVPQGVYAYYCAYQNGEGQRQETRGTVTFIWGQE